MRATYSFFGNSNSVTTRRKLSCQEKAVTETWQLATEKKALVATLSCHVKAEKIRQLDYMATMAT